jgi:phosphate transport system permease protein
MAVFDRRARRRLYNMLFVGFCTFSAVLAVSALAAILFSLLANGLGGLNLAVFTQSTPAPGGEGGLANAIVGSIMMCAIAMVAAVLLSAPSILIGLFVYEVVVAPTKGFSGFAGALALALLAAPVVTRTTEDVLKLQSKALRESGVALGAPMWTTVGRILWKAAAGGILTGGLLAFARISGETAPLLFTALNNQFFSLDMTEPMANLPVVIFNFALSAYDDWRALAWAGALLIAMAVLATNILVRVLSREPRR